MPYTNTTVTTSTSGTWNSGTGLSYSTITLIDGIPHSAQLEVERVFTVPRSTGDYATIEDFLNNSATTQKDKQQVFIIPASRITFNETSKTITAIDLPSTGNTYDFNPDGAGLANVPVPAIVSGTSVLKVRRKTVSNQTLVEWSAGSKLTSAQLNLEVKQLIHLIQELIDKTTTEVNVSNTTIGTVTNYSITPIKLSAGGPTWDSSSRLGIGMTPTTRTLSLYHQSAPTIQLVNSTTGSLAGDGGVIFMSGNDMLVTNQESANLKLETSNTTRLTISSSGDVGIGTITPTTKLQIAVPPTGTTLTGPTKYGGIHLTQNTVNSVNNEFTGITTAGQVNGTQGGILFQSSGAYGIKMHFLTTNDFSDGMKNRMTLNHLGMLGIGTEVPSYTLDVVGTGRFNNATNENKLLIEGYGNNLAYGIQFKPANNTSTFPCRFHNAAGNLVGSIQTDASSTYFNGTLNGNVMGNIGTTIVVTVPPFEGTLASTASSGFCSKSANSNVVILPAGTWVGYVTNMSNGGVISTIANVPETSGGITCTALTNGSQNLVNLVLMRSA